MEGILTLIIIIWGIGTTLVGIYLSYHNNFKQNVKLITLLEEIRDKVVGVETVPLTDLAPKKKDKNIKEIKIKLPEVIKNLLK